ncbi:MAG: thiamine phosphate synthase [Pseudomonadota bacterium]|nr:thiamine phosphate synthase [Pseudomonadota bacterium]
MTVAKCRLFVATTGLETADRAAGLLAAALAEGDAASVLVKAGTRQREIAEAMLPPARARGVALLVEQDADLAAELGADGLQMTAGVADLAAARRTLGSDAILGVDCGSSRHAAMSVGEAGADYVGFSGVRRDADGGSIVAWWANLFEVPCVALDELTEVEARRMVLDGADFVTPPRTIWESEAAAAQMVRSFNSMFDECTR